MAELSCPSLHKIVSAIVYTIATEQAQPGCLFLDPPYNDITQFILREHARMPGGLREALAVATLGFDAVGIVHHGKRFHCQSHELRARQVIDWKQSAIAAKRDLIRFYESLTAVALHERDFGRRKVMGLTQACLPAQEGSELSCAVAIIGSGPGGSITACELAEAGFDAVLLEEGPYLAPDEPAPFSLDEMENKYRNGGLTVAIGKTKISYVEARCVGGGSEVNSGLYHRTPPDILEQWRRDYKVNGLSESDLHQHFSAIESDLSVSRLTAPAPAASLKLHEGALRLGWKSLEVPRWFRAGSPESVSGGLGVRQTMTRTYIPRFLRADGRLLSQYRVKSIAQDGHGWKLNAGHINGRRLSVCARAVFVCGGAVQTPALLRRSGFRHCIGNSLRVHPTVKLVARFPEPINVPEMGVPVHQIKEFSPRISLGCSISTPSYLALGLAEHTAAMRSLPAEWRFMANYYAMVAGEGVGSVRTLPGLSDPIVRYRLTPRDRRDLADGIIKLAENLFAAGATELLPTSLRGVSLRCIQDLKKLPTEIPGGSGGVMTIHLFSSCPMGEDRTRCATDSFGRVHGFANLFIADASLLPGAPGVNPQGTIMAIARRNVQHFIEGYKDGQRG